MTSKKTIDFIAVSTEKRSPRIEERFNLHIGEPYRFLVETTVYDGILSSYVLHLDQELHFLPVTVELKDGFCYRHNDSSEKIAFDHEILGEEECAKVREGNFGRILDVRGFQRIRSRLIKEG